MSIEAVVVSISSALAACDKAYKLTNDRVTGDNVVDSSVSSVTVETSSLIEETVVDLGGNLVCFGIAASLSSIDLTLLSIILLADPRAEVLACAFLFTESASTDISF